MRFASTILTVGILACAPAALAQDAPWDCSDPGSLPQQGMNYCAGEDFSAADEELNAVYRDVRAEMKATDKGLAEWDPKYVGAEEALLKAQRAWIDYRDGHCDNIGFQARGGTLEPLLVESCKADMTRKRTQELKELVAPL